MASENSSPQRAPRAAPTGSSSAETRNAILDATIQIMREDGYAAVSSRRIAVQAGLKSKLVHYYFRNMDELFLAVFKRIDDEYFAQLTKTLASRNPLKALWKFNMDSTNTTMVLELNALATHRKSLRVEMARASERLRLLQSALLERAIDAAGLGAAKPPPIVLSVLALAVSRLLAMDSVLGVGIGHQETLDWIEDFLDQVEGKGKDAAAPKMGEGSADD